jgi:hypothetical protein
MVLLPSWFVVFAVGYHKRIKKLAFEYPLATKLNGALFFCIAPLAISETYSAKHGDSCPLGIYGILPALKMNISALLS